jgi:hypothetical protein
MATDYDAIAQEYQASKLMPWRKHIEAYTYFNLIGDLTGKDVLEQAIQKEPLNVELRFIRFSIQCNSPKFLDYHSNINADKLLLLKEVKAIKDVDLKKRITKFLNQFKEIQLFQN